MNGQRMEGGGEGERAVGDENGFQAMKMAFKDFLNKIIVSIWCQET